jgi:hypothetical protein
VTGAINLHSPNEILIGGQGGNWEKEKKLVMDMPEQPLNSLSREK